MKRLSRILLGGILIFGLLFFLVPQKPRLVGNDQWIANGGTLPSFQLPSTEGAFSTASLIGHWTLLMFGYTHCPDICPTDLAMLGQAVDLMKQSSGSISPQVVFISGDIKRDTVPLLKEYVTSFHAGFVGAVGDVAQMKPLRDALGVYFQINEPEKGHTNYTVDHTSNIFLIDPKGRLRGMFRVPQDAAVVQKDILAMEKSE